MTSTWKKVGSNDLNNWDDINNIEDPKKRKEEKRKRMEKLTKLQFKLQRMKPDKPKRNKKEILNEDTENID